MEHVSTSQTAVTRGFKTVQTAVCGEALSCTSKTLLTVVCGICFKFLPLACHTDSHYGERYLLLCLFLDNVSVFALMNPQNMSITFLTVGCILNITFTGDGGCVPYFDDCPLDCGSGPVFCPH